MKLADMLETKSQSPTKAQLDRLAAFALVAWDDVYQLRYGYAFSATGVSIYVKQVRRGGERFIREGADVGALLKEMEATLVAVAVERTKASEELIRRLVEKALARP